MDDPLPVRMVEGSGYLLHQPRYLLQAERLRHHIPERPRPLNVAHHDETVAVILSEIIHGQDVRVMQSGYRFRLAEKPFTKAGGLCVDRRQDLHRHVAVKAGLVGFVDGCHAPFADWLHDAVLTESLAYKPFHTTS